MIIFYNIGIPYLIGYLVGLLIALVGGFYLLNRYHEQAYRAVDWIVDSLEKLFKRKEK